MPKTTEEISKTLYNSFKKIMKGVGQDFTFDLKKDTPVADDDKNPKKPKTPDRSDPSSSEDGTAKNGPKTTKDSMTKSAPVLSNGKKASTPGKTLKTTPVPLTVSDDGTINDSNNKTNTTITKTDPNTIATNTATNTATKLMPVFDTTKTNDPLSKNVANSQKNNNNKPQQISQQNQANTKTRNAILGAILGAVLTVGIALVLQAAISLIVIGAVVGIVLGGGAGYATGKNQTQTVTKNSILKSEEIPKIEIKIEKTEENIHKKTKRLKTINHNLNNTHGTEKKI